MAERPPDATAPDVTVVIPTMDRWPLLRRTLGAVLRQEDVAVEAVVVDDGSTDGTPDRVRDLGAREPRVRLEVAATTQGPAPARNLGLRAARGEWVVFSDDDDVWGERWLRTAIDAAQEARADWVYGAIVQVDGEMTARLHYPIPEPERLARDLLEANPLITPSSVVARTSVVRDLGGFDERLWALADWDMWLRLALHGTPAVVRERHVAYVKHGANMSLQDTPRNRPELRLAARKHRDLCRAAGVRFAGENALRWYGNTYRDEGRRFRASGSYLLNFARHRQRRDLARGVGILLGERVMRRGRELAPAEAPPVPQPAWLAPFREGAVDA